MTITGDRLREAMADRDIDQEQLAKRVGCTQGAISQILLGNTQRSRFLPEIADVLGVPLRWLRGEAVSKEPGGTIPPRPAPDLQLVTMQVALPSEDALTRMFEGLLLPLDRNLSTAELARMLAQRLPTAFAQLRDLLPETTARGAPGRGAGPRSGAKDRPASPR